MLFLCAFELNLYPKTIKNSAAGDLFLHFHEPTVYFDSTTHYQMRTIPLLSNAFSCLSNVRDNVLWDLTFSPSFCKLSFISWAILWAYGSAVSVHLLPVRKIQNNTRHLLQTWPACPFACELAGWLFVVPACRRCGLRSLIEATTVWLVATVQKVTHSHQHTKTVVRYKRQISSTFIADPCGHDFAPEHSSRNLTICINTTRQHPVLSAWKWTLLQLCFSMVCP